MRFTHETIKNVYSLFISACGKMLVEQKSIVENNPTL
jgi:hypothetical protein